MISASVAMGINTAWDEFFPTKMSAVKCRC